MRLVSVCLFLLSATLEIHPVLATNEDWSGFWRLKQKSERSDENFQLWVSAAGRLRLYDKNWNVLQIDSRGTGLGGQSFKLQRDVRGGLLQWSATREGDTLSGTWEFRHVQALLRGDFSGSQVSEEGLEQWSPLKEAHADLSAERVLNLARLLKEGASQGDFEGYWRKVFVPGYLAFLPDLPEVSRAHAAVTNATELKGAQDFDGIVTELVRRLNKNYPTFRPVYGVVVTPFVDEVVRVVIAEERYLLINPASFARGLDPETDRLEISRKVLAAQLFPYTRHYKQVSGSVYKLGLELFLMEKAYPDQLPQILGVGEKRLVQLSKGLPKFKERMRTGKKLKENERSYLSLAFARALAASYSFQGLLKSHPRDIVKKLVKYLHPPSERPTAGQKLEGSQGKKGREK